MQWKTRSRWLWKCHRLAPKAGAANPKISSCSLVPRIAELVIHYHPAPPSIKGLVLSLYSKFWQHLSHMALEITYPQQPLTCYFQESCSCILVLWQRPVFVCYYVHVHMEDLPPNITLAVVHFCTLCVSRTTVLCNVLNPATVIPTGQYVST